MMEQLNLLESSDRLYDVEVTFYEYVFHRGATVLSHRKQTHRAKGRSEIEAQKQVTRWFQDTVFRQYKALDGDITNICAEKPLYKPCSLKFKAIRLAKSTS